MKREDIIERLKDNVFHNRITRDELIKECEDNDIELYEEVLEPIGYNTCDRCGDYGDTELDFLWVDGFDWDEEHPKDKAIIKAMEQEGVDYCAVCWDCINKLAKKGGYED